MTELNMEQNEERIIDQEVQRIMQGGEGVEKKEKQKKKFGKKKLLLIPAVIAVLFILSLVMRMLSGKGRGGLAVSTAELTRGEVQEKLKVSGPVSGTNSADVMSDIHAEVRDILVREGDHVEKGQVLAYLNSRSAEQALELAEHQLALAKANQADAAKNTGADYAKAQQALQSAETEHARKLALFQTGAVSAAELEAAEAALQNARATMQTFTVKKGKVQINDSYSIQIQIAEKELEKAQDRLAETTVLSPIAGTVTRVNTKPGQFVDRLEEHKPLFTIENLDELELEIRISEYSIGKVSVGQKATISASIMGDRQAEGEVLSISPTGEMKGNGSTERVIPTKIRVDSRESGLISGITARAEILLDEAKDVFVVPLSALVQTPEGGSALAFVEGGTVFLSPVRTGVESDIAVEVSPLDAADPHFAEGRHFILTPGEEIAEGVAVRESLLKMTASDAAAGAK